MDITDERRKLANLALKMRMSQRAWFKHSSPSDLAEAKRLERELDQLLAKQLAVKQDTAGELFPEARP